MHLLILKLHIKSWLWEIIERWNKYNISFLLLEPFPLEFSLHWKVLRIKILSFKVIIYKYITRNSPNMSSFFFLPFPNYLPLLHHLKWTDGLFQSFCKSTCWTVLHTKQQLNMKSHSCFMALPSTGAIKQFCGSISATWKCDGAVSHLLLLP